MSSNLARHPVLELLLAKVLHRGTWVASTLIAVGLIVPLTGWSGASSAKIYPGIVTAGIALIILLPALRVLLMAIVFVRERDFRFGAIAVLVLAIIALGAALGMHMASGIAG